MSGRPQASRTRRQLILLAVLVVALLVVSWYLYFPATPTSVTSQPAPVVAGERAPAELPIPEALRLESLAEVGELGEARRNPFAYGVRPPPPPPPRPIAPPPPPVVDVGPPRPQGPPPIALRLTGLTVMPGGGRSMVTLKDPATNAIHQAFEGDIVDGRYRIVKVGLQSVVVSYLDGSGVRTIGLGG
jgi:hypothetical protein